MSKWWSENSICRGVSGAKPDAKCVTWRTLRWSTWQVDRAGHPYGPSEENADALEITPTKEELRRIDEVAPRGVAAGLRYPEQMMKTVGR